MERRNFLKRTASAAGLAFTPIGTIDESIREQPSLPSHEAMVDEHPIEEKHIVLAAEGEGWRAICSPAINTGRKGESPFDFDTVGDAPADEELGELFSEKFDSQVDKVFELISNSDDPLETIMEMEPEDISP